MVASNLDLDRAAARGDVRPGARSGRLAGKTALSSPDVRTARPQTRSDSRQAKKGLRWPVVFFLVGLVVPWVIPLGPLSMSVYRIVLLVMLLPCLVMWVSGKAGPIR